MNDMRSQAQTNSSMGHAVCQTAGPARRPTNTKRINESYERDTFAYSFPIRWLPRLLRLLVFGALAALVLFFFRSWLGPGLPTSHRSELVPQITYIWQIAEYLRAGYRYVHWDPSFFAGYTWLRFLPYPVYYIPALLSLLPGLTVFSAVKIVFIAAYIASAWTMAELAYTVVRTTVAAPPLQTRMSAHQ